jgi:hypothetical protein
VISLDWRRAASFVGGISAAAIAIFSHSASDRLVGISSGHECWMRRRSGVRVAEGAHGGITGWVNFRIRGEDRVHRRVRLRGGWRGTGLIFFSDYIGANPGACGLRLLLAQPLAFIGCRGDGREFGLLLGCSGATIRDQAFDGNDQGEALIWAEALLARTVVASLKLKCDQPVALSGALLLVLGSRDCDFIKWTHGVGVLTAPGCPSESLP